MTYSLGEVEALCRKAAKGAGFSWGMAEEAGRTARFLCSWGLPGASALARYLEDCADTSGPDDPMSLDWVAPRRLCPLICGTLLNDLGEAQVERRLHTLAWPILCMPFGRTTQRISWSDADVIWNGALQVSGQAMIPLIGSATLVQTGEPVTPQTRPATRADLTEEDLATLTHLAARTYAPETDASKLSGAGAGLTDQD